MGETTKLPASFSNGGVFESSTAFIMLQKNSKRKQTMTEDVFRIFRRTGRQINKIGLQIEKERDIYLKDAYSNKNALYKELSGIPSLKETTERRRTRHSTAMPPLPHFSSVTTSDLICRPVKSQLARQKPGQEVEVLEPERRMNVNILKRCECCKRLAFRYKERLEMEKLQNELAEEEKKQSDDTGKNETEQNKQRSSQDIINNNVQANVTSRTEQNEPDTNKKPTRLFEFTRQSARVPVNKRFEMGFAALKRQSDAGRGFSHFGTNHVVTRATDPPSVSPTKSEPQPGGRQMHNGTPIAGPLNRALSQPLPSPSPTNRQKIRVKFQPPFLKEKVHLNGNDWSRHIQAIQGKTEQRTANVVTLSRAYVAFKKLLRKMDEEHKKAEEQRREAEGSGSDSDSRPNSAASKSTITPGSVNSLLAPSSAVRWQPLRRRSRSDSRVSSPGAKLRDHFDQVSLSEWSERAEDEDGGSRYGDYNDNADKGSYYDDEDSISEQELEGAFTLEDYNH